MHRLSCQANGPYSYEDKHSLSLYYHHAHLEGLEPETVYQVRMMSDGVSSPNLSFKTAPSNDRPFSLLYGADSRTDREQRVAMDRLIGQLFEASTNASQPEDEILALAHGGDYITVGTNLAQWSDWMTDHQLTTTREGRLLPIIPARGNHDRGRLFNDTFGFAWDEAVYYGLHIGPQVRLITLDTEASIAGDQLNWLRAELEAARPAVRWLIAQYHRPAYPAVKWPSGALVHWVPLFEEFNVDLVCEGDGHTIKRTVPIRDGVHDETGVVYVGEGGLGVRPRTPKTSRWYLKPPGMADSGLHVQKLTFTKDRLRYECILANGEVSDAWERSKAP